MWKTGRICPHYDRNVHVRSQPSVAQHKSHPDERRPTEGFRNNWCHYTGVYFGALSLWKALDGGFPKLGVPFGDPHNKDYSILGSTLGSPYFGKLLDLPQGVKGLPQDLGIQC